MRHRWSFNHMDGVVRLMSRVESDDGATIGDMFRSVGPGEQIFGVSFEQLLAASPGLMLVDENERGEIQ